MFGSTESRLSDKTRTRTRGLVSVLALAAASAFVLVSVVDPSLSSQAEAEGLQSEDIAAQSSNEIAGTASPVDQDEFVVITPTPTPTPTPTVVQQPQAVAAGAAPSIQIPQVAAPDPGSAQSVAAAMVAAKGWGPEQYSCLYSLWQKESNWNVYAQNRSSGAYGIPQSLPGSKMATHGADWQTNPATQIAWGLDYIAGRYGTPCGAWGHSQRVGWY
ncbi:transglycosylase SLT domain-containing protein [Humidisolicoccus flavus]|uniref:aggregation-promoting factor C-terminal-like domain-containing protein n=1 Tax=Humidisolicoccus flavus TaxID=3111414 RepID=UPI00324D8E1C